MSNVNINGNGNGSALSKTLSLSSSIQIGALVALGTLVGWQLQPLRADINRIDSQVSDHIKSPGHSEVVAQLSVFRTEIASIREKIDATERLNSAQHNAFDERIDKAEDLLGTPTILWRQQVAEKLAHLEAIIEEGNCTNLPKRPYKWSKDS
jgi:hypothetical protein